MLLKLYIILNIQSIAFLELVEKISKIHRIQLKFRLLFLKIFKQEARKSECRMILFDYSIVNRNISVD